MEAKQKSFTLIELLVVIAIIGLLSAIILVAVKEVRERARIAKSLQFSTQIHHILGADGMVFFDSNNENTRYLNDNDIIKDYSGNDNNGVVKYDGAGSANIVSDCVSSNCLELNNTDAEIGVSVQVLDPGSNSSLDVTDAITIQVWIKSYRTAGIREVIVSKQDYWLLLIAGRIEFYLKFDDGSYYRLVAVDPVIPENKWVHIITTYNGSKMKIFADSKEVATSGDLFGKKIKTSDEPLQIGSHIDWDYFSGVIDELRIYNVGF